MSAPDSLALEPLFQDAISMAIAIWPLELWQLFGNDLFYYYYPDDGSRYNLGAAWVWLLGLSAAGLLVMLLTAVLLNICCLWSPKWRMRIYTLIWLPALIQLQDALWSTVTYFEPSPGMARLRLAGLMAAISTPIAYGLCLLICNWCTNVFHILDNALLFPTRNKPSTAVGYKFVRLSTRERE